MKKKLFFICLTNFLFSQFVFSSDSACVDILIKNNIPRSKAIIDCEKKMLIYSEDLGLKEVEKEVPIYGVNRPDWMTRSMFNSIKSDCYNNSKPAYDAACSAGYSIGKEGECRLPTYIGGQQVRKSTTPTYRTAEECYKKKGIYEVVGYKKEKVQEKAYQNVEASYDDMLGGSLTDLSETGKTIVSNIKKCMEIVGKTPRSINGMSQGEILETPGKRQTNSVFTLCNKHVAASIVKNEACYNEINANASRYPISANKSWWTPEKEKFCGKLMKLKSDKGFLACKEEIQKHSFSKEHIERGLRGYLSFIEGQSPNEPDLLGCLNNPNLKWFADSKNIGKANVCVKKVLSKVSNYHKSNDISAALRNCYVTNTTDTCMALSELRGSLFFDLCGESGLERFKKTRVNSCMGDVQRKDKAICQYRCLSFLTSINLDREEMMTSCRSDYFKVGDGDFQSCFYQVNDQFGGNLNIKDSLAFCPASKSKIASQLGQDSGIIQGIFDTLAQ